MPVSIVFVRSVVLPELLATARLLAGLESDPQGTTGWMRERSSAVFTEMVEQFMSGKSNLADLEELFNNQSYSDYYVVFLRLLVSAYIQRNADFYANFIAEDKTVRQFCETVSYSFIEDFFLALTAFRTSH
ncbi:unnamed protein product [Dibothriocephalus latus]|uniref:Uncharacterized protein n=1 Tax=Dibothriocephalus latus TaxID=60516 RepID=A0A3P7LLZ4_DIBLA|nr:unnamed protein product [Dibothriocephalus latus]